MARQGRAGAALAIAALGSFFAGCVATVVIALVSEPLTILAQRFQAPEYFALMTLGLIGSVVLAKGSVIKAVAMVFIGLLLGTVGTDLNTGQMRMTFGVHELADGIGFVPVAMGLFGVAEIIAKLGSAGGASARPERINRLMPSREDWRRAVPAVLRGTAIGSVLGVLPGGGALLAAFAAYTVEKKIAAQPERFGRGAIEGVAAPEAANNAGAQTSFIPMLTLGIPPNAVMALMIGAMAIHGITPGPQVVTKQPELFWGMVASMWIGNLMLVVLNLPLIWIWVRLLQIPYRFLFPAILIFCAIGVYSLKNSLVEILFMAVFGVLGYVLRKLDCEPAPLLLGLILGPMLEENFRRAMILSGGDVSIFVTRPISLGFLVVSALLLAAVLAPAARRRRDIPRTE
jgi:TctA family transporter